ncbi:MAG TPA: glycogen synthase GlgA [Acetobacteraceae bacterium]|nr:glycogen synthase GlgA [Acetobacteraceae bacterium]
MSALTVLSVVSELFPLIKTGGLADVAGALPAALEAEGVHTVTLVPGYPAVLRGLVDPTPLHRFPDLFGGPATLLRGTAAGLDLLAIDAPHLYARLGGPYFTPDGHDWPDNAQRFAALSEVAARIAGESIGGIAPDVLHAHDWQAGLAPAYLQYRGGRRPGTVMTVHNLAFQGRYWSGLLGALHLPPESFSIDGVECYGDIGFLKAGLYFADRITTVSPTYAAEIQTPAGGMALDGLLRTRSSVLSGILNGIDDAVWDPAADDLIVADFSWRRPEQRAANKASLQAWFGVDTAPDALLLGVVSRLTWQKGVDLVLGAIDEILRLGGQLVVLGAGEPGLEAALRAAAAAHPGRIGCVIGYDEAVAHQIQAGVDALLVPSRFEPCGLTQLCAMRYGALPIVARVGGLADTVIDANAAALAAGTGTGLQFSPVTQEMLHAALRRAAALWRRPAVWRRLQENAMRADVSWRRPAGEYARLYREIAVPVVQAAEAAA